MRHPETHLVNKVNTRAGGRGRPDRCFYCPSKLGEPHAPDCVIRTRTVVVRMTVEYVVGVPESWGEDQILYQRNDGSWCQSNAIDELAELAGDDAPRCLCNNNFNTRFQFVREATETDERACGVGDLEEREQEVVN